MSTTSTSTNPPLSINLPTGNYSSQNINSPTLQNMPPHPSQGNPNMLYPTNNKLNGQNYPEAPKSPTFKRVGEDHRLITEGVKLAMEIIESKLPNHMGYAHLLLTRTLSILNELSNKTARKEIAELLERETKDIEAEREIINSKMFAYELKGL